MNFENPAISDRQYLTEIHYVELNMSQRCKISVQRDLYSYLKGSDNIQTC